MNETEFSHRDLPTIGKRVQRLGVASNYGLDTAGVHHAAERGANVWFWSLRHKRMTPALKQLLSKERDKHVVVAMSAIALSARGVRSFVDRARKLLGVDQLDLYMLPWLGRASRFSSAIQDTLVSLRDKGVVQAVGTSIHDRVRAGKLVQNSVLDAFMIRYNAAHPGAEQDIFPNLEKRKPLVISYTTTSWRQLLKPIKGIQMEPYPGSAPAGTSIPPLTPELCYRFVLSNPHVHVALTAPQNQAQLDQNLDVLEAGPLTEEEDAWVRQYGREVRARKKLPFI